MYICTYVCVCMRAQVDVRGQVGGVSFSLEIFYAGFNNAFLLWDNALVTCKYLSLVLL